MEKTLHPDYIAKDFNSFCSIIEELEEIALSHSESLLAQPTLWYRGQACSEWEINPSVQRYIHVASERVLCHSFYHRVTQINTSHIPRNAYDQWAHQNIQVDDSHCSDNGS